MVEPLNYSHLNYSVYEPPSFPHIIKVAEFNPIGTFNSNLSSGDTVRIKVSGDELWDPYSAYVDVTIDFSQNPLLLNEASYTNKIVQLDSSAHSIFQTIHIMENNETLELIKDHDVLAAFLKDMSYDVNTRYQRDYEGLGGNFTSSMHNSASMISKSLNLNDNTVKPLKGWHPTSNQNMYIDLNTYAFPHGTSQPNGDIYTTRNIMETSNQTGFQPYYQAEEVTYDPIASEEGQREAAINFAETDKTNNGNSWQLYPWTGHSQAYNTQTLLGLTNPYNPAFTQSAFEPMFSRTVPQKFMKNGFVKVDNVTQMTFSIPLLSGIFGCLMHPQNYKLIPLKYFKELNFDFQFNPHAFFTSWFCKDQTARSYQVKKLVLRCDVMEVRDQAVLDSIDAQFQQGIRIQTQTFTEGPQYPISNGAVPPTLQVNLGFDSLKNIFLMFLPNDYTLNSCLRKQYRLSMGLTSLQVKLGTEYYPQLGIKGNGGNNYGHPNNNDFIRYLWKAFGKHVAPANSVINPHNFSVNCRAVNPNFNNGPYTNNAQLSFFEENRVIGKAVYAIPMDLLNYHNNMLSGKNTNLERPFEINMTYDASKIFPRTTTLYSYFHHDIILLISPTAIKSFGRA